MCVCMYAFYTICLLTIQIQVSQIRQITVSQDCSILIIIIQKLPQPEHACQWMSSTCGSGVGIG